MFNNPFSFEGRIRRTEYGISFIIYIVAATILNMIWVANPQGNGFVFLLFIPLVWFMFAQAAKRCHDVGNSGWGQLIPFYALWLLFQDGNPGQNQYGMNPKAANAQGTSYGPTNSPAGTGGYTGGYNGGHNAPSTPSSNFSQGNSNSGEYKPGDLYR